MFDNFLHLLSQKGSAIPCYGIIGLEYVACFFFLSFLLKKFDDFGLTLYIVAGGLICNLQVLKQVSIPFLGPCPLGTIYFTTLFIAQDLMVRHFSFEKAKSCIQLSCIIQLMILVFMLLTSMYTSYNNDRAVDQAIMTLFFPSLRFFVASLLAFFIAGYADILLFARAKKMSLLMRQMIASFTSGWIDAFVFNVFAWIILAPCALDFKTVWHYIFSSQMIRIAFNILCSFWIYLKPSSLKGNRQKN